MSRLRLVNGNTIATLTAKTSKTPKMSLKDRGSLRMSLCRLTRVVFQAAQKSQESVENGDRVGRATRYIMPLSTKRIAVQAVTRMVSFWLPAVRFSDRGTI
jgi:hypothetical protein